MRGPETERLLQAVRNAVAEARRGGVTVRACIWDATVAAVDGESHNWPSKEARRTAEAACRAVDPPTGQQQPDAAPCPHAGDTWFDRSVCPEPCGGMHDRCAECGAAVGGCLIADQPAPRDAEVARLRALLARVREFAELYAGSMHVVRAETGRDLLALLDREVGRG